MKILRALKNPACRRKSAMRRMTLTLQNTVQIVHIVQRPGVSRVYTAESWTILDDRLSGATGSTPADARPAHEGRPGEHLKDAPAST